MALWSCCSGVANRIILLPQVHGMDLDLKGLGSDLVVHSE
jgi:hypothetical protein